MWSRSNIAKQRRRITQGLLVRIGAAAPTSDDSASHEEERFKRLDESLAEIQSLVVGHLHALRSQFQTARELSAKLAACSRADTVRVSRLLGASTDSGSASVADTDPDACESSGADAATSGESGRVDDGDSEGGMTLVAPAEYFDEPEAHEPHRLHARLLADQRHLSAVATALTRQQRAHEALGAATVQAAERLLGAAALAPAARLRDALAKLRPTMDKRRRNHTDVAAYARRVEAADTAAARASSKRRQEAEAEAEALHAKLEEARRVHRSLSRRVALLLSSLEAARAVLVADAGQALAVAHDMVAAHSHAAMRARLADWPGAAGPMRAAAAASAVHAVATGGDIPGSSRRSSAAGAADAPTGGNPPGEPGNGPTASGAGTWTVAASSLSGIPMASLHAAVQLDPRAPMPPEVLLAAGAEEAPAARLDPTALPAMHAGLDAGLVSEAPVAASGGPKELPDDPEAIAAASRAVPLGPVGIATHAYVAREADELALLPGQQVTIVSRDDDGWWLGSVGEAGDRTEGRFPFTYIRVAQPHQPDASDAGDAGVANA